MWYLFKKITNATNNSVHKNLLRNVGYYYVFLLISCFSTHFIASKVCRHASTPDPYPVEGQYDAWDRSWPLAISSL